MNHQGLGLLGETNEECDSDSGAFLVSPMDARPNLTIVVLIYSKENS